MTMFKAAILIICSLLIAGVASEGSYVITGPKEIQPGSDYVVIVYILEAINVLVEVTLQERNYNGETNRYEYKQILNVSGTFDKGIPGNLTLPIEPDLRCNNCEVRVRGTGGLQFEQVLHSIINNEVTVIIIQTDKAIYKAGQTVQVRAFAVFSNLQIYSGRLSITYQDPNRNKIKVLNNVTSDSGVVEDSFKLSEDPVFGTWGIIVNLVDISETYTQNIEVAEYELPRFEVTVELPPYALTSDTVITGKVKAKYTFGQPVKGFAELHVGPNEGPNSCGDLPRTTEIGFNINGEADFSIPKEDIERVLPIFDKRETKFTVFVKEYATDVRLNGSSVLQFHQNKYEAKFTDNTQNVFKPGFGYIAYIQVTTPDKKPPTDSNIIVSVYTSVSYQLTVEDQAFYNTGQFSGTYGLPGINVTLPASGLLLIDIDIPKNATSITIKATVDKVQITKTVEKMYSKSNNFIQLTTLETNVKSNSTVYFIVDGTEPLNAVVYEVLSRGSTVASGTLDGQGRTHFLFPLFVTPEFAPDAHLLVYSTRGREEIIADSLAFKVDGIFKNHVAISFNKNESEPNKAVNVEVTAEPGSVIFLGAVDQSSILLKTGNDITPDKVNKGVAKFDKEEKSSDSQFSLSNSAAHVQEVFTKNGLTILTDVPMPYPPSRYLSKGYDLVASQEIQYEMSMDSKIFNFRQESASTPGSLKAVEHIRKNFPESFLWITARGENGTATVSAVVPDTITSWIASAFATHPTAGLGVASTTATLTVFRPFFLSLTFASSVIRGEQVVVQAVIFNYLSSSLTVTVTCKKSNKYQFVKPGKGKLEILESNDQVQVIQVDSQKQGVVFFPIVALEIGVADIEIAAQSTVAADGVRRQLIINPEGAPVKFNYPIFVNLGDNGRFQNTTEFSLPGSVINGSDRARIKASGDLIGSSLDGLTSLLELPTGCGEQSMVKTAPNVYIADYLQATSQLIGATKDKIYDLLESGYQRQLTYQRSDGGFSAFGNSDDTGSTWLTAYVCDVLFDVRKHVYIDPRVMVKGIDWLINRQTKEGAFNDFGKVLDSSTQGTSSGPALTAFVLISLNKNSNLSSIDCSQNTECYRSYQWENATVNAVKNLEVLVESNSIKDQFALAVVSYALTIVGSSKAALAFGKLETFAHKEDGLTYWTDNATVTAGQGSEYSRWRPQRVQARPINILITSYCIMTYTALNRLKEAFPAVQWLIGQKNPFGGFVSSQDTSVALRALSAYATKSIRPDTNIDVKVSNQATLAEFHINKQNALVLQVKELTRVPSKADISISGTGLVIVEIETTFNINKELTTPSFDVSTVLLDDDLDSFNLMICTKWLWDTETGMVVQEISIPSGFNPDLSSLGNVAGMKRSERKGNTVNVYFDKISKSSVCYSIKMVRTYKVARTQENFVVTWAYYNPRNKSTVFWQPKKLRDSTVCDVCDKCCQ